ncbi:hypothetical protein DCAR_0832343 [Daucus carota subsp. sativus]|uniref:DUF7769 domain-containing protein n=1 Tax=Daucus carota subsp. sativus TaxID=79200 RepID=A0AAF0XU39_DAUCS|nr:PREDICTED: uncharacterized protein LOC108197371 isoform X2 [Daucus carota subsp. sativus]WOH12834.1 hypothetical protein DCAR_0832343 [Daucus carota subsp. sativus]
MSFTRDFDLNLSPGLHDFDLNLSQGLEENEETFTEGGSNNAGLFDLNIPLEDLSEEDIRDLDQSQEEITRNISSHEAPLNGEGEEVGSHDETVTRRLKTLSNVERREVFLALLHRSVNGKLRHGTIPLIAQQYSVSNRTISRIWRKAKGMLDSSVVDVSHRKTKNCGRKRIVIDF